MKPFLDTLLHVGMRKRLINEIAAMGISNKAVLEAMLKVPRHFFFDSAFLEKAYENRAFPIGSNQTISQPYTVAYQLQWADIQKEEKVLEIGTGSGYLCCVLAAMGANVITLERHETLHKKAVLLIKALGYDKKIKALLADGFEGAANYALFDKIIVSAAAPFIPIALIEQLRINGKMVIPVGEATQVMQLVTKTSEHTYSVQNGDNFVFVPMLTGIQ